MTIYLTSNICLSYTGKCSDKKLRLQPKVVRNYVKRIISLADAPSAEALHVLNYQNYLEFKVERKEEPNIAICSILDIMNRHSVV